MKVHHGIDRPSDGQRPLVVAIGFFDGLHRGHREILRALLRLRRPGFRAAAFTFSNHPATFLRPDRVPPLIATLEELGANDEMRFTMAKSAQVRMRNANLSSRASVRCSGVS